MRKTEFANDEYYHIYNRGVDKREVFLCEDDYVRFIVGMNEFNRMDAIGNLYRKKYLENLATKEAKPPIGGLASDAEKLVEIICYCLNPNHFHFILKQLKVRGIEKFMQRLGTSYTMYFNKKYSRSGSLFQGPYKSIHIESNEYLLYLSAYVNANNFIHGYSKSIGESLKKSWLYSSLLDYVGKRNGQLCNKEPILGQFNNSFSECEKYINDNAFLFREKKEMEKYILE